jgi:hypothetical protein
VRTLLGNYLTLQNQQDYGALQSLYSEKLARSLTESRDRSGHRTSYFFDPKLTDVSPDGSYARMSYNVLFASDEDGAEGRTCSRMDVRYQLVREKGKLVIDSAGPAAPTVSCETG